MNYAVLNACQAAFAIIDKDVTDRGNAEQLQSIRESLNALEGTGLLTFRTHQYWAGSNPQMDALAPLNQVAGKNAPSPLLLIMGCIRAFFAGSLMTSLMRGRQEQGWFKGNKEFDE